MPAQYGRETVTTLHKCYPSAGRNRWNKVKSPAQHQPFEPVEVPSLSHFPHLGGKGAKPNFVYHSQELYKYIK